MYLSKYNFGVVLLSVIYLPFALSEKIIKYVFVTKIIAKTKVSKFDFLPNGFKGDFMPLQDILS